MKIRGKDIRVTGKLVRVARLEGEGYEFVEENPEQLLETLRQARPRVDLFTFTQRLPETSPHYPYRLEWDNFAALEIKTFDYWWSHQIGFKARNKAKQAAKSGVTLREVPFGNDLVEGIWKIYNECPVRGGRRFRHFGKDLKTVYREEATYPDRSVFIGAFFEGELIGFAKLVSDESNTQAGLMNILSMMKHRDKAPTNALIAEAVRSCSQRHIRYLVYSRFAYGKKERSSVSDFKERNGLRRIDVPRYYVPLTAKGKMALELGLHKSLVDRLPIALINALRDTRAAWYNRRFQLAEKQS